ncbi:MAG: glycosyl hydrolase family 28-related protein [Bacteroidota bacterium]
MGETMIRWLLFALWAVPCYGQVLPANRAVDWTLAGLNDTNTLGFTYYNVVQEGAVPDGITSVNAIVDSLLALNQPVGVHLHFPAGSYFFNQPLSLPSNTRISGAGADATHWIFDLGGTGHSVQTSGSLVSSDSSSLTVAGVKGNTWIVVANANPFFAGAWVRIRQQDADLVTSNWALNSVGQLVKVDSVGGDTLYLHSALRLDYSLNRLPKVVRIAMKRNIGLECLSLERMDNTAPEQASVIHFTYAENCWFSGLESNKTTFGHVEFESVANSKVEKSYFYDAFDYGGGGRGYGVVLQFTTNECLIENNVFKHLRHSIILQAGANGNVATFNHSTDPYWTNANPLLGGNSAGELVLHGNYVYANLFEQNDVQNIVIDNSHGGNGPYNTFLRNRASLYGIFFSDNTSPSQNFLGNEIPNSNFPYSSVNYTILGNDQFSYGNNNKGTVAPAGTSNLLDTSYYYAVKPDFVQGYQWGRIGLPNAINSAKVPATNRFEGNDVFAGACGKEDYYAGLSERVKHSIYPNPVSEILWVRGAGQGEMYRIFDLQGRLWLGGVLTTDLQPISVGHLPQGMYLWSCGERVERFVKN